MILSAFWPFIAWMESTTHLGITEYPVPGYCTVQVDLATSDSGPRLVARDTPFHLPRGLPRLLLVPRPPRAARTRPGTTEGQRAPQCRRARRLRGPRGANMAQTRSILT